MTKQNNKPDPYILYVTEYYEGQCTGFNSTEYNISIFDHKPTMEDVAPMVSEYLDNHDMGKSIAILSALINTGEATAFGINPVDLVLKQVDWNKQIT